ncbi:MAG: AraC family transcriptional regulator [Verrucomicrobiota bacterium]|nr:AraC family transcriptional regulator [Verrucomicrobiota bacterium]
MSFKKIPGEVKIVFPEEDILNRFSSLHSYVRQSGSSYRTPWAIKDRKLLDYLLVYVEKSGGIFTVGDISYKVDSGDLFWIPPNELNSMTGFAPKSKVIYIHFDLIFDSRRSLWNAYIPAGTEILDRHDFMHPPIIDKLLSSLSGRLDLYDKSEIKRLMTKICYLHDWYPDGKGLLELSGLMLQLISHIIDNLEIEKPFKGLRKKNLDKSRNKIVDNCSEIFDIKSFAKDFGCSASHFRKIYKEYYKESPQRTHINAKIKYACRLLSYTDKYIGEIADELGYSKNQNFTRVFKTETGLSPRQFRENVFKHD